MSQLTPSRRHVMQLFGLAVGSVAFGARASVSRIRTRRFATAPNGTPVALPLSAGREVRALFGDLRPGAALGPFRIAHVFDVHHGAIPVVLRDPSGHHFQVDVLRRGERPGVGDAQGLSVYLTNGGDGHVATHNVRGLGAMALADALAARVRAGARLPGAVLTLEERAARHGHQQLTIVTG